MFMKGFCLQQSKFYTKTFCALCMVALCALTTTAFAVSSYDCGNSGGFPMYFAGCRPGYYYEDWQNADESLSPDEVGECIKCPSGYTCAGGFTGPITNDNDCDNQDYTVVLNANSGTFPSGVVVPTEYNTCKLPLDLPTPLRDGYTFYGWRTWNAFLSYDKEYTFTMPAENMEIFAVYAPN